MKLSTESHLLIASTLKEALDKFSTECSQAVVTDIHLLPKQSSGELIVFNDDDEELAKTIIEEWVDYDNDDFDESVERILRADINKLQEEGALENLSLLKPYSFVLVDEERETIAELLLVDDDTLLVNDELLKGLDEELDDFLKQLLAN